MHFMRMCVCVCEWASSLQLLDSALTFDTRSLQENAAFSSRIDRSYFKPKKGQLIPLIDPEFQIFIIPRHKMARIPL